MLTHRYQSILGDIPHDWQSKPLLSLLSGHFSGSWGDEQGEQEVHVIRSTNFNDTGYLDLSDVAKRYYEPKKAKVICIKENDILIERSGGGPTQPVGRVGYATTELEGFAFSNFVQLLRPDKTKVNPIYLSCVLFELNRSGIVERLQHQTTQMRNLDYRDYIRVCIPFPSSPEQEQIAESINLSNEAIKNTNAELQAARRLKTALMQELFTKGIPGRHKEFKETKIGSIPYEWELMRVENLLSEPPFNGVSPASNPDPPGTPILNVSCINDGNCDTSKVTYVEIDENTLKLNKAKKGDFFVLRGNGNREYVGTGGSLKIDPDPSCIFSDKLIRLRFDLGLVADGFMPLMWQSYSFIRRLQSKAVSGSGLWMIGKRDIRREWVALPKKNEQSQIVEIISTTDDSIKAVSNRIEALVKVKKSLLQNLLTGKVRVNMEAAHELLRGKDG